MSGTWILCLASQCIRLRLKKYMTEYDTVLVSFSPSGHIVRQVYFCLIFYLPPNVAGPGRGRDGKKTGRAVLDNAESPLPRSV